MRKSVVPFSIMAVSGFLLTLLSFFWGAPFIRVLRQKFGFIAFWATGIFLSLGCGDFWFLVASVWIVIGVYTELEAKGIRWIWNGLLSVSLGTITLVGGSYRLAQIMDVMTKEKFADVLKTFLQEKALFPLPSEFDYMLIVNRIPAIAVIAIVLVLAHALIFEKSVYRWFRIPRERFAAQIKLLDFKLPDVFVWIGMAAFLGAILEWKGQEHAINLLYVCSLLFFFQGIAILEYFYKVLRVGFFVRAMGYFLFVFQFFIVLSFVGFVDFWVDFRKRIRKLPAKSQDNQNARLL